MTEEEFAAYQRAILQADDERIKQACEAAERELGHPPSAMNVRAFKDYTRRHYLLFREKFSRLH